MGVVDDDDVVEVEVVGWGILLYCIVVRLSQRLQTN
jgi:hypothetical protein